MPSGEILEILNWKWELTHLSAKLNKKNIRLYINHKLNFKI